MDDKTGAHNFSRKNVYWKSFLVSLRKTGAHVSPSISLSLSVTIPRLSFSLSQAHFWLIRVERCPHNLQDEKPSKWLLKESFESRYCRDYRSIKLTLKMKIGWLAISSHCVTVYDLNVCSISLWGLRAFLSFKPYRTLTVAGDIIVWLVSSLTGFNSVALVHSYYIVW